MMSKVWKNTNDTKGMKQMHKVWKTAQGMKNVPKVWKMCPRYTTPPKRYEMLFEVWNACFLEKQWFFIPLWVYFISFWVWKYRLFFPDGHDNGQIHFPASIESSSDILETYAGPLLSKDDVHDVRCSLDRLISVGPFCCCSVSLWCNSLTSAHLLSAHPFPLESYVHFTPCSS